MRISRRDSSRSWHSLASFIDFATDELVPSVPTTHIAAAAGMSRANFYLLKGGRNTAPSFETLVGLFNAFGLTVSPPSSSDQHDFVLTGYADEFYVELEPGSQRTTRQRTVELLALQAAATMRSPLPLLGGPLAPLFAAALYVAADRTAAKRQSPPPSFAQGQPPSITAAPSQTLPGETSQASPDDQVAALESLISDLDDHQLESLIQNLKTIQRTRRVQQQT